MVDLLLVVRRKISGDDDGRLTAYMHGPAECFLDTVEACALDAWPHLNEHFPFIHCVESLVYHKNYTQWETCFEKLNLKKELVTDCVGSDRGKELELRHSAETPPHKFVPWVVVDGLPLYKDYRNFVSYICKAYKGTAPIPGCTSSNSLSFTSEFSTISPDITSFDEQINLAASA
ncbi:hypothetical protein FXO38_33593 [Capsicum annuum]|nr:hypothetical protein FXO38_33593 [Capsicum annuum]